MKKTDFMILEDLRLDARSSLSNISKKINMPPSTIYDRINKFRKSNIITRYTTLIDFPKLGFNHHAKIALKDNRDQKEDLLNFLNNQSCINSFHEINHGFDFFIETIHEDIKSYSDFTDKLKNEFDFIEFNEYQVTNVIKTEVFSV